MEVVKQQDYIDSVNTSNKTITCQHCDSRDTNRKDNKTHKICDESTITPVCSRQRHKYTETVIGQVGKKKKNRNADENNQHNAYKCHMCCKEFRSICCLHNHLMDCIKSRSYIYDDSNKTAYPFLDSIDSLRSDEVGDNAVDKDETPSKINNRYVNLKERKTTGKLIVEVDIVKGSKLSSEMYELWLEFYKAYTTKAKAFNDVVYESEDTDDYDLRNSWEVKKGKRKSGCPRQLKRKTNRKNIERPSKKGKLEKLEQFIETITDQEEPGELLGQVNPAIAEEHSVDKNWSITSNENVDTTKQGSDENVDSTKQGSVKNVDTTKQGSNGNVDTTKQGSDENVDTTKQGSDENVDTTKQGIKIVTRVPIYQKRKSSTVKQNLRPEKFKVYLNDSESDISTESEHIDGTNEDALNNSTEEMRKRGSMIKCDVCDKLIQYRDRKRHAIGHQDAHPFACKLCPKSYKHEKHLSMHMHSHDDVLPFYCHICGQGFVAKYRLDNHMWVHSKPEDKQIVCTVCDKRFSVQGKLNRHMSVHTGERSHQCDICGSKFARPENLREHINGVHKKVRRFTCGQCGGQFVSNYQLQIHAKKHSGQRPFECSVCGANFILRRELRKHMEVHKPSSEGQAIDNEKNPIDLTKQTGMVNLEELNAVNQLNKEAPIILQPCDPAF